MVGCGGSYMCMPKPILSKNTSFGDILICPLSSDACNKTDLADYSSHILLEFLK